MHLKKLKCHCLSLSMPTVLDFKHLLFCFGFYSLDIAKMEVVLVNYHFSSPCFSLCCYVKINGKMMSPPFHRLIMGKCCLHASSFIFDRIIIKVAGIQHGHKILDQFDFGPDQTTHFGVTCPWLTKILHFRIWTSLRPVGQSWSTFMCSITGGGKRLHNVLRQISKLWCPWQQKAPIDL